MKARINKINAQQYTCKDGRNFSKIKIECSVVMNDHGDVRHMTCEMTPDFFTRYFKDLCGVESSKDLIGRICEAVVTSRFYSRSDGTPGEYTYIKFLNLLDSEGKPIVPPKREHANIQLPF